jgi:capsular polysaccharide transport system ATP-binding protein
MIELQQVTKRYPIRGGMRTILDSVNLQVLPGERRGILGRNGGGKSTLVRIIGGAEPPCSGRVIHGMSVSWPMAFGGAFQSSLTGLDNLRFICRVYGVPIQDKISFVEEFADLGTYFYEPVSKYSSGMKSRLAFALSLVIDFDCFLIDETWSVGDKKLRERCEEELFLKRAHKAMVLVSHNPQFVKKYCQTSSVMLHGKLHNFNSVDEGYAFYEEHISEH